MLPEDRRTGFASMHDVSQFAIDCTEPAFKVFLHEVHGMPRPLTDDNAVAWALIMLDIRSASELNSKPAARDLWAKVRASFLKWIET